MTVTARVCIAETMMVYFIQSKSKIDAAAPATPARTVEEVYPIREPESLGEVVPPVESRVGPGVGANAVTAAQALLPLIVEILS